MLVCKDCGRYLTNLYDKCPGCGSTNLTHEETKYSFLVEKTPSDVMEFLKSKLKLTSNNEEFLMGMNQ